MIVFPACGGKYELLEGRFFAPLYGGQYSANEQCDFHIQTYPGSQIMVAFSKFSLEQQWSASCVDYVEVYMYRGDPGISKRGGRSQCGRILL